MASVLRRRDSPSSCLHGSNFRASCDAVRNQGVRWISSGSVLEERLRMRRIFTRWWVVHDPGRRRGKRSASRCRDGKPPVWLRAARAVAPRRTCAQRSLAAVVGHQQHQWFACACRASQPADVVAGGSGGGGGGVDAEVPGAAFGAQAAGDAAGQGVEGVPGAVGDRLAVPEEGLGLLPCQRPALAVGGKRGAVAACASRVVLRRADLQHFDGAGFSARVRPAVAARREHRQHEARGDTGQRLRPASCRRWRRARGCHGR